MQLRTALLLVALFGLCGGSSAYAWNESGHRIVAASAAAQMSSETLAEVVRLLQQHPRYEKDLARYRPRNLKGLSEAQWLLGQAAQWPDHARGFKNERFYKREPLVAKYHHGNWHYINLPLYLSEADQALEIEDPILAAAEAGQPQDVLQALNFIGAALLDPKTTDADKGLWLSWALHLIADVHQPLHTSAMFSLKRWPKGDRGGNEVKIAGSGKNGRLDSLHYYWDSAISNRREPAEVARLVRVLGDEDLAEPVDSETDPVQWIREGGNYAELAVYGPLREQLVLSPQVKVTGDYTRRTHEVALARSAMAARRTANWLEEKLRRNADGAAKRTQE